MKIDLVGMIFNWAGRETFDGLIIDDAGNELGSEESLHFMIMEYAKVVGGGKSDVIAVRIKDHE